MDWRLTESISAPRPIRLVRPMDFIPAVAFRLEKPLDPTPESVRERIESYRCLLI